jgi:hypothetical protein
MEAPNTSDSEDELDFEGVYSESDSEIIGAAYNAFAMVDSIDTAMMSKKERDRVIEIRRMAIELCYNSLKNIYDANQKEEE